MFAVKLVAAQRLVRHALTTGLAADHRCNRRGGRLNFGLWKHSEPA